MLYPVVVRMWAHAEATRSLPDNPVKKTAPLVLTLAVLYTLAIPGARAEAEPEDADELVRSGPALGLMPDLADSPAGVIDAERPFFVRLVVEWSRVERERGVYDWSWLEPLVDDLSTAGKRPVLCLTGSNPLYVGGGRPPSPLEGDSIAGWLEFVRSAASTFGTRVRLFEIWDRPDQGDEPFDPDGYAFLLKNSSLAINAEAEALGASVAIAQGSVAFDHFAWQQRVWEADTAPYAGVLPIRFSDADPETIVDGLRTAASEILQQAPAPVVWAHVESVTADAAAGAIAALGGAAAVALIAPSPDPTIGNRQITWAAGVHETLADGFVPAPTGDLTIRRRDGTTVEGGRVLARFFREESFSTLVVYDLAGADVASGEPVFLAVGTGSVRDPREIEPLTGKHTRTSATTLASGQRGVRLSGFEHPGVVTFLKTVAQGPGTTLPTEDLEITRERGLTAEEIIARYRRVQKLQDDRLENWIARGRVDFHFKLAQAGGSFDLTVESNYFWERGGELQWEEVEYKINGNVLRWKNIPEFPLIQPEKVITLPLDLTLDRTYVYKLEGEDRVGGRPCYVLSFRPTEDNAARSLYRGRVWIDKENFTRPRTGLIQTNLEPPVLSNEERDDYQPIRGPDGRDYWLATEVDGQQVWTAAGRNFVVQRNVFFDAYQINLPAEEFEARRQRAYDSDNRMMQETDQGYRYLERQPDGTRTVKWNVDTDQLFLAFGAFKDNSISNVVPIVGVNYFNYDLWDKNIQTNLFFAGAFGFFNFTKPDVFDGRMDAAVEAGLFGIKRDDKVFLGDDEVVAERVRQRSQSLSGRGGIPLGKFWKINLIGNLTFIEYFDDDEAQEAREDLGLEFVLPQDHTVATFRAQVEFNRRAWSVSAEGSWSSRSDWSEWGLFDPSTGMFVEPAFDPSQKSFTRWRAGVFKEWYLPHFQKIRGELNYLDGDNLDRFSRYQFGFFGDNRLNGFSGTGVRFDRGTILRAGYAFNVFDVIQFNATVDTAQVLDRTSPAGTQQFTGVGLSGNFVGPWKTLINLSYGRAVQSDIEDLEGSQEFLLVILKLFK